MLKSVSKMMNLAWKIAIFSKKSNILIFLWFSKCFKLMNNTPKKMVGDSLKSLRIVFFKKIKKIMFFDKIISFSDTKMKSEKCKNSNFWWFLMVWATFRQQMLAKCCPIFIFQKILIQSYTLDKKSCQKTQNSWIYSNFS